MIKRYNTLKEAAEEAAEAFVETAENEIRRKGWFTFAAAGGNTPKPFYELLASEKYSGKINWKKVHVFMGDERFVPWESDESNFGMLKKTLIDKISIPPLNLHPVRTEVDSYVKSAALYQEEINGFFKRICPDRADCPGREEAFEKSLDLILLGMGGDGHTASLFPGTDALLEEDNLITGLVPPSYVKPAVPRITMTFPLINSAKNVFFLISGEKKKALAEEFLLNDADISEYPAARVWPEGNLIWFIADRS